MCTVFDPVPVSSNLVKILSVKVYDDVFGFRDKDITVKLGDLMNFFTSKMHHRMMPLMWVLLLLLLDFVDGFRLESV